jgi:uncharacterized protein with PIN domain
MTNVQGNQAPAKQQKMLKKFENSSMKTIAEQSMSSQTPLRSTIWSLSGDFNRKFEHAPHCCEVCSSTLDKWSKAAARKLVS